MVQQDDFLPGDYNVPEKPSQYMKFEKGENTFRILARPVIGFEHWEDVVDEEGNSKRNVTRYKMSDKMPRHIRMQANHFWGLVVWNYKVGAIQILQISQKGIQQDITAFSKNPKWGSPLNYDLTVTRTGEGQKDTKYSVAPNPKEELSKEIKEALSETKFDLEKLFTGEDPIFYEDEDEKIDIEDLDEELPDVFEDKK